MPLDIDDLLARGRDMAEELMPDQCIIRRRAGAHGALDAATGARTPPPLVDIYTAPPGSGQLGGACKVQTWEPHESTPTSGQRQWTVQRYSLHLPTGSPQIRIDDRVEIVASRHNPQMLGRTYRISGLHAKSMPTAVRLLIDEVVD